MPEDKKLKEKADKKVAKEDWLRCSMFIEVLAGSAPVAKDSLQKHIEKIRKEDGAILYKETFEEIKEVKQPMPNIPVGFSYIVELEMGIANLDKLIYLAMNYGPTNIEILEPDPIKVSAGEAQGIANSVTDVIHRFAQMGAGGIVIQRQKV